MCMSWYRGVRLVKSTSRVGRISHNPRPVTMKNFNIVFFEVFWSRQVMNRCVMYAEESANTPDNMPTSKVCSPGEKIMKTSAV